VAGKDGGNLVSRFAAKDSKCPSEPRLGEKPDFGGSRNRLIPQDLNEVLHLWMAVRGFPSVTAQNDRLGRPQFQ
jgi:hypothetical protein